jgi:hypothetical protein
LLGETTTIVGGVTAFVVLMTHAPFLLRLVPGRSCGYTIRDRPGLWKSVLLGAVLTAVRLGVLLAPPTAEARRKRSFGGEAGRYVLANWFTSLPSFRLRRHSRTYFLIPIVLHYSMPAGLVNRPREFDRATRRPSPDRPDHLLSQTSDAAVLLRSPFHLVSKKGFSPMTDAQRLLIPRMSRHAAKLRYCDDRQRWLSFSVRAGRNPYMAGYLMERDQQCCRWCGNPLFTSVQIHHRDYVWICAFSAVLTFAHPTPARPNKPRTVPDCAACHGECAERFDACACRMACVHPLCNAAIERARG